MSWRVSPSVRLRADTDDMSTADVAQVASAAFTAGAAGAAYAAVRQSQIEWRASREPEVSVDVVETLPAGTVALHVANLGGVVLKAMTVVIVGDQSCVGFLPPTSFLQSGELRVYDLELNAKPEDDSAIAVVYGFDTTRRWVYAWSANGQSRRWPTRRRLLRGPTNLSAEAILRRFYPDAPDPFELERRYKMMLRT
jgi:hypothetical protein